MGMMTKSFVISNTNPVSISIRVQSYQSLCDISYQKMWGNYAPQNNQPMPQSNNALNQMMQRPFNPSNQYPNFNPNMYQPNLNQPNQPINQINQLNPVNQMNPPNPSNNPATKQVQPQPQPARVPQYANNQMNIPNQANLQQMNRPINNNAIGAPQVNRNLGEPQKPLVSPRGYPQPQQPYPPVAQTFIQNANQFMPANTMQADNRPIVQQQEAKVLNQNNIPRGTVTDNEQIPLGKADNVNINSLQANGASEKGAMLPSAVDRLQQDSDAEESYFQYILMYGYRSRKGFQAKNPGKVNQDSLVISTNINEQTSKHYFGVCDGHGSAGHDVSGFLRQSFPPLLNQMKSNQHVKDQLYRVYAKLGQKLAGEAKFDLNYSGSTCVGCFLNHNKLYCCNVGDSRAVLGRYSNEKWTAEALSQDQKATNSEQVQRIIKAGGQVQPLKDAQGNPMGVARVWIKGQNYPGLAMTRSFGDLIVAGIGVTNIPQIKQYTLTRQDKIIVVGSDGLWQFLSSQNVIDLVSPYYERRQFQQASSRLLDFTVAVWNNQHLDTIDDISFIVVFLYYDVEEEL